MNDIAQQTANAAAGTAITQQSTDAIAAALGLAPAEDTTGANATGTPGTSGTPTAPVTVGDTGTPAPNGTTPPGIDAEAFAKIVAANVASEVDRQLAARLNTPKIKRRLADDGDPAGGTEPAPAGQQPAGPSGSDMRQIKVAYRDGMTQYQFLSDEERNLADTLSGTFIRESAQREGTVDDAAIDRIGAEAAQTVREQIDALRTFYAKHVQEVLRARGLLVETKGGQGTGTAPVGPQTDRAKFNRGAEIAAARHGAPTN